MATATALSDPFAAIAAQVGPRRNGLVEPPPPDVPARILRSRRQTRPFRPTPLSSDGQDLARLLQSERRRMQPFLRRLAPTLDSLRAALRLDRFAWRLEEEADRADALRPLRGDGAWNAVTVPHYGPPTGRATAYYRTTFTVTPEMLAHGAVWLRFGAADYRAHVSVNGRHLVSHEGHFAPFACDATACVRLGDNTLLVRLENDGTCGGNGSRENPIGDKIYAATGPGWDEAGFGWHHCPPGMGLWQAVTVEACAPTHIADLFVRPLPDLTSCEAWIELELPRRSDAWQEARLRLAVFGANHRATAVPWHEVPATGQLGSGRNDLRLPLRIPRPRTWTPEAPWLYELHVELLAADGTVLDRACRTFGLRTFVIDETSVPKGRLLLNGSEIRLRGANTMGYEQQAVMQGDAARLEDDMLLARVCRMNFLRLTQRPVQPEVYDCCDRLGILVQTDLPLFGVLRRPQFCEAVRQCEEMERLIRAHPSCILVSYINEPFPATWGTNPRRSLTRPELEAFFVAADRAVHLANPDRAIKPIDGDYDPPGPGLPDQHCYTLWYNGHGLPFGRLHRGWWMACKPDWMTACGEFGAEGLDFPELMRRRYPAAWLADDGTPWTPERIAKAQSAKLQRLLFERPEPHEDQLTSWCRRSQAWQARATRLMTEALRRQERMNSFAIHLFIDAWPAGWMKTIMDCERHAKPAFWAYREALAPMHVSVRTDRFAWSSGEVFDGEAWICNDSQQTLRGAVLRWQLEVDGRVLSGGSAPAHLAACAPRCQGRLHLALPRLAGRVVATVRIALDDAEGRRVHDSALELQLHPTAAAPERRIAAFGGDAIRLLRELGLRRVPIARAQSVVVSADALVGNAGELQAFAERGGTVTVLALPPGQHQLAGDMIEVLPSSMGGYDFAARVPGHPLLKGLDDGDLHFWHDEAAGMITPFLTALCEPTPGWSPILLSGAGQFWGGPGLHEVHAAQEKRVSEGVWRIVQIALTGRVRTNPAARLLALHMLGA